MSAQIKTVKNPGDLANERIVIHVDAEMDIGMTAIFASPATEDGGVEGGEVRHAYWFEDRLVKCGDLVVLYTKAGSNSVKQKGEKNKVYFHYWNLSKPLWLDKAFNPVLVSIETWEAFDVSDLDKEPEEYKTPD